MRETLYAQNYELTCKAVSSAARRGSPESVSCYPPKDDVYRAKEKHQEGKRMLYQES